MRAMFLDLDGCLVDSRRPITTAMNVALEQLGLSPQPPSGLYRFIGPPLLGSFRQLLTGLDANPDRAHDAVVAYRQVYSELARQLTTPMPGIPEMLAKLAATTTLGVVTSKPLEFAEPILEATDLRRYFVSIHGPALTALTERKAAALQRALDQLPLDPNGPSECVMVGDRRDDVIAGRACATRTVGVTWGIGDRAELEDAGADLIVEQPAELIDLTFNP